MLEAPKGLNEFDRRPQLRERRDGEDLGLFDRAQSFIGVFVEQSVDDEPGLVAVLGKVVTLFHLFGAFLTGERRLIPCHVAEEIERIKSPP